MKLCLKHKYLWRCKTLGTLRLLHRSMIVIHIHLMWLNALFLSMFVLERVHLHFNQLVWWIHHNSKSMIVDSCVYHKLKIISVVQVFTFTGQRFFICLISKPWAIFNNMSLFYLLNHLNHPHTYVCHSWKVSAFLGLSLQPSIVVVWMRLDA